MILVDGLIFDRVAVSLLIMWTAHDDRGVTFSCGLLALQSGDASDGQQRAPALPLSGVRGHHRGLIVIIATARPARSVASAPTGGLSAVDVVEVEHLLQDVVELVIVED